MSHSPQHLDRLRLRHLRLLQLIDEQGSLRAVAAGLNLTQPAVSQMLKDLEFALGADLVDRSVRGVALNAAGRLALQRARAGLATLEQLARELDADQALTLRIGTNPALLLDMIPETLRRLRAGRTPIRYRLETGMVSDMMMALSAGDLDCYFGRIDWEQVPQQLARTLRSDALFETDLVLICPGDHPAVAIADPVARDLAEMAWAMQPRGSNNRIAVETAMRNAGVPQLNVAVEVSSGPNGVIQLVQQLGVLGCVSRTAVDAYAGPGRLRVLEVSDLSLPKIRIGFTTTAEMQEMPAIAALRDTLLALSQEWFGATEDDPDRHPPGLKQP